MPEAVTIRPATREDLGPMSELLEDLFTIEEDFTYDEARSLRGLEMILASGRACALVAQAEDAVVGMCSGQLTISTAEGGPAVLVEDVVVRQGWRDRGIGKQLMNGVITWAQAHGATRLQLLAEQTNEPAIDFYTHTGWTTTRLICLRRQVI